MPSQFQSLRLSDNHKTSVNDHMHHRCSLLDILGYSFTCGFCIKRGEIPLNITFVAFVEMKISFSLNSLTAKAF